MLRRLSGLNGDLVGGKDIKCVIWRLGGCEGDWVGVKEIGWV